MKFFGKSDSVFNLSESGRKNPKIKACGYAADDKSFLYFQNNEYENDADAIKFYDESKDNLIKAEKSGGDYWEDNVAIVDGGYMTHAWQENNLHINVIGRVEKIAFTIRASGAKTS